MWLRNGVLTQGQFYKRSELRSVCAGRRRVVYIEMQHRSLILLISNSESSLIILFLFRMIGLVARFAVRVYRNATKYTCSDCEEFLVITGVSSFRVRVSSRVWVTGYFHRNATNFICPDREGLVVLIRLSSCRNSGFK
jgi:predicted RNA-binding Zn-ribbon protein involved in translation (DUF1610 family)